MIKKLIAVAVLSILSGSIKAQSSEETLDKVVAVVGNGVVLYSDVMSQYAQFLNQGNSPNNSMKCTILDQLLTRKLLYNQAMLDSLTIEESQVDDELNRRVRYFTAQFGSQEKMEEFLGKSLVEFKEDSRADIRELLLAQQMQGSITRNTSITPIEVRRYFNSLPKDSLPYYSKEVEVGQIVLFPKYNKQEKQIAKEKLQAIKERVIKGEDFATLAILYSQDPGSARAGGELGFIGRGDLVKDFEAASFKLKPGELSDIIETEYGYHLIKLIQRRGEQINVRHILIKPEYGNDDFAAIKHQLDSVYELLTTNKVQFGDAAAKFSEDKQTLGNGGMLMSPTDGGSRIAYDQLEASVFLSIDTLKPGSYSKPVMYQTTDGKLAYRILYYKSKTEPHQANLEDDYQRIQAQALADKEAKAVSEWFQKKRSVTYVRIDPEFGDCSELKSWFPTDSTK